MLLIALPAAAAGIAAALWTSDLPRMFLPLTLILAWVLFEILLRVRQRALSSESNPQHAEALSAPQGPVRIIAALITLVAAVVGILWAVWAAA